MGGTIGPLNDNAVYCGLPSRRWSAVYATNGVVSGSDPKLKKNIAPIKHNMLDIINEVNPVTFNWIEEKEQVLGTTKQLVHDHEFREMEHDDHEIRDGKAIHVGKRIEKHKHALYDELPVHDQNGNQIFNHIPPGSRHEHLRGQIPDGMQIPHTHKVPRMVEKDVPTMVVQQKENTRTHWGFLAPELKTAVEKHTNGMDFGGIEIAEDGTHLMAHHQLLPILWKAVQQLSAKVVELEGKLNK
jgi:hypothetical protein